MNIQPTNHRKAYQTDNEMNNKELQLATFEQAKMLKEAGFDWPTDRYYQMQADEYPARYRNDFDFNLNGEKGGKISAPSIALALKWALEEKGVSAWVVQSYEGTFYVVIRWQGNATMGRNSYETYDAAERELMTAVLKLIAE